MSSLCLTTDGRNLVRRLISEAYTQKEFADELNVSQGTLGGWLSHRRDAPSITSWNANNMYILLGSHPELEFLSNGDSSLRISRRGSYHRRQQQFS
jgi:hypothetical protein